MNTSNKTLQDPELFVRFCRCYNTISDYSSYCLLMDPGKLTVAGEISFRLS